MSRDVSQLHPELQKKIAQLEELCAKEGLPILITDCVRNRTEQADCVRRGTSSLAYPNSMHNWGVAFDFCKNIKGHEYDDAAFFNRVGKLGQSIGLEWGGAWYSPVDKPHFQLSNWGTGVSKLKSIYRTPEKFRATWGTASAGSGTATANAPTNTEVRSGYMFNPLVVQNGSKGTSVLLLQEILRARGIKGADGKDLTLDRIAGNNTVYAINAYQGLRRKQGVELGTNGQNDGICGKKMWNDLIAI